MSKKSILWIAVVCSLVLAFAGLVGCRAKEPVVVATPEVEVIEEPVEPIRWPLTGIEADDETAILARTLSVKIDNHPQSGSKVGINNADVVFETLAEGGITRFNAIYQSDVPEFVMPIRSARDSDTYIVPQFGDALFFYSGGNSSVLSMLRSAGVASMSHNAVGDDLYSRNMSRFAPHNLQVELSRAYEVAHTKNFDIVTTEPITGLEFQSLVFENPDMSSIETTTTQVNIPFSDNSKTQWNWDESNDQWTRISNGAPQYDGASEEQINTTNLIVMWAQHSAGSQAGAVSTYNIDLVSGGRASIFMNGQRIDGTWEGSDDAPPVFRDDQGNEILLTPGRTWISVMPTDYDITSYGPDDLEAEAATGYSTGY